MAPGESAGREAGALVPVPGAVVRQVVWTWLHSAPCPVLGCCTLHPTGALPRAPCLAAEPVWTRDPSDHCVCSHSISAPGPGPRPQHTQLLPATPVCTALGLAAAGQAGLQGPEGRRAVWGARHLRVARSWSPALQDRSLATREPGQGLTSAKTSATGGGHRSQPRGLVPGGWSLVHWRQIRSRRPEASSTPHAQSAPAMCSQWPLPSTHLGA